MPRLGHERPKKIAIFGAAELYLDFVNLCPVPHGVHGGPEPRLSRIRISQETPGSKDRAFFCCRRMICGANEPGWGFIGQRKRSRRCR